MPVADVGRSSVARPCTYKWTKMGRGNGGQSAERTQNILFHFLIPHSQKKKARRVTMCDPGLATLAHGGEGREFQDDARAE